MNAGGLWITTTNNGEILSGDALRLKRVKLRSRAPRRKPAKQKTRLFCHPRNDPDTQAFVPGSTAASGPPPPPLLWRLLWCARRSVPPWVVTPPQSKHVTTFKHRTRHQQQSVPVVFIHDLIQLVGAKIVDKSPHYLVIISTFLEISGKFLSRSGLGIRL